MVYLDSSLLLNVVNAGTRARVFDYVQKSVHRHLVLVRHQKIGVALVVFSVIAFDVFGDVRRESDGVGVPRRCRRNRDFQVANFTPSNDDTFS